MEQCCQALDDANGVVPVWMDATDQTHSATKVLIQISGTYGRRPRWNGQGEVYPQGGDHGDILSFFDQLYYMNGPM